MPEFQQNRIDDLSSPTTESWRTLRILGEMVNAFDELNAINVPCVSIFGSARSKPANKEYQDAEKLAAMLVNAGFGVITGGGPGVMEAANKGASEAGGVSVGLHIKLPFEQNCNRYVKTRCNFHYFFIRKLMFVKYACATVVMAGGMGTIDEFSEACVLSQTGRAKALPIILYDSSFWNGFLEWVKKQMVGNDFLRERELEELSTVCDTPEQVIDYLRKKF